MRHDKGRPEDFPPGLTPRQRRVKRAFDLTLTVPGLIVLSPVLVVAVVAATVSTRRFGIFTQERIGEYGETFKVIKLRTMRDCAVTTTTVTTSRDPRITPLGAKLRATKLDELPNLVNVVIGHMSLVGPRPDVPGWADRLHGEDRVILTVKPGITGPASLAFRNEERLLAGVSDPEVHNRIAIWPEKVRINAAYVHNWSFRADVKYLAETVAIALGVPVSALELSSIRKS